MNDFVIYLNPDQVKKIADMLIEFEEVQGSVSYLFVGGYMLLEIVKEQMIDNKPTIHVARYRVYDYFIEPEGKPLRENTKRHYRELMLNYFGELYAVDYLLNY